MKLSHNNAMTLVLELNKKIEEYAESTVENIIEKKNFDFLTYPPNNGLTDFEKAALVKLDDNEHLKNALRKVFADNSAAVVFDLLSVIDGTSSPGLNYDNWKGVKLVDEEADDPEIEFSDMLHDEFYSSYWEWRKLRGDKNWKLDTHLD